MSVLYRLAVLIVGCLAITRPSAAQSAEPVDPDANYTLHISQAKSPIKLDGLLDESAWTSAAVAGRFFQNFPFDSSFAKLPTDVRVTFDANFLYVGVVVTQPRNTYITRSLKRDFEGGTSDVFTVNIDPFNDKLNGFHFALSPYGVQREGLIANGSDLSLDWDNKWYAEVKNYDDRWVAEIAIPFKTLRYRQVEGQNTWRINFGRNSLSQNETTTWHPVPRQFRPNNMAFSGLLVWDDAPPKPGSNISVIPYLSARTNRDAELRTPTDNGIQVGGDAKIAITPSLNLDLTVNPDFSQVEVDKQVTNLSRFELFFPERRQFFLENNDLFGTFGFPNSRPFFSRRIGIARGTLTRVSTDGDTLRYSSAVNVPIQFGARLSGKLDKNWRLGLLNMQTARVNSIGLPGANYSVSVVQRRIFSRSTIGAVFVNKQNFLDPSEQGLATGPAAYNRVAGLEYNLYSKDNKWTGEFYYHRSFSPQEVSTDAQTGGAYLGYTDRRWEVSVNGQYIGSNYRADVGFVPRRGVFNSSPQIQYKIYPKQPSVARIINTWGFGSENQFSANVVNNQLTDRNNSVYVFSSFLNQSESYVGVYNSYTYLFFGFDPTNTGSLDLPEGTGYTNSGLFASFESNRRKNFSYAVNFSTGQYFNGHSSNLQGGFAYRYQPYGVFAVDYSYTTIGLPKPYASANFWLVGPRAELSFSRSVFFSTFIQYNTQANNVNINSRLQWRFRPVSDLFLVYTDNYYSNQFFQGPQTKNRALVLKMTYWLNV
jgi:hypothetical protein